MQKMEKLILEGELAGYIQRKPEGIGAQIDEGVAQETVCPKDKMTLQYMPFVNEQGSYRAFAVCPKCDDCFEF